MTIKTNGFEFKKFYNDPEFWPEGTYHDDTLIKIDGVEVIDLEPERIKDESIAEIEGGVVFIDETTDNWIGFEDYFKRWKRKQKKSIILIEINKGDYIECIKLVKEFKGRIINEEIR